MTEFTPYPEPPAADTGARYVVAVTSNRDRSVYAPDPVTAPMTLEKAQELLARMVRGEPCDVLDDEVDLMAEVGPGHLLAFRASTVLATAVTYDIQIARVLWSRS